MDIQKERAGLEKKFYHLCEPVVQEAGYRLYDLEYLTGQKVLRLYIEDPRTKTAVIEDCVKVDNALSPVFETETWIPEEIVLEVSSPGIFRELSTLEHFKTFVGDIVMVIIMGKLTDEQTAGAPKGVKGEKKFRGVLSAVSEQGIVMDIQGFKLNLEYGQIKKVTLDPDLNTKFDK
ncbi:MAG: ribosome maturation factor RimP [Bacteriovoracaceae bacterium]